MQLSDDYKLRGNTMMWKQMSACAEDWEQQMVKRAK